MTPSPKKSRKSNKKSTTPTFSKKSLSEEDRLFVISTLEMLQSFIGLGYSHDNFVQISRLLDSIKKFLHKEEVQFLEESWRDSYTDSCNFEELGTAVDNIISRFSFS